jgi:fatty acid desaturase
MLVALVASLPVITDLGWWWSYAIVVPLLGAASYKVTVLMHECGHRTMFRSRRANRVVGLVCGALLGVNFDTVAKAHWDHHRLCGTDEDTGDNDYLTLQFAAPSTLVRHLLMPLTGVTFARMLLGGLAPTREKNGGEAGGSFSHAGVLASIVAVQLALAWLATGFGRWWLLALVYPLSAMTLGLFFSRVRAFCEHVSAFREPGACSVRTHVPNWFDRCFFYTLNMNYHVEHHLYPQIPACRLPVIHRELAGVGYFDRHTLSTSIAGTIRRCLADARSLNAAVHPDA